MSSLPATNDNVNGSNNKHSLLDRTIPIVLPVAAAEADFLLDKETPSRKQGVSVQLERLHRLQGTSLISMGIHILQQQPSNSSTQETTAATATAPATATASPSSYSPTSWYASACTIFHRFYHGDSAVASLLQRDVWSVAMASTLIAAKLEEIPLTVRQLIIVYAHMYTRRRHVIMNSTTRGDDDDNDNAIFQKIINHPQVLVAPDISESSSLRRRQTNSILKPDSVQVLSPTGPIWKQWHEALLHTENCILRQLGFVIHWIPNRHVHKFVYAFLHVLQIMPTSTPTTSTTSTRTTATSPSAAADNSNSNNNNNNNQDDDDDDDDDRRLLAQGAWNYCNLSYRLDLCVRFEAPVIACAAIHLAALDLGLGVQDLHVVKSLVVASNDNHSMTTTTTTTTTAMNNPWWKFLLLGTAAVADENAQVEKMATSLIQIANTLAGLAAAASGDAFKVGHNGSGSNRNDELVFDQNQLDVLVASVAFLKSLNQDSFHGPDSFVWEMANRHDAAAAAATTTSTAAATR